MTVSTYFRYNFYIGMKNLSYFRRQLKDDLVIVRKISRPLQRTRLCNVVFRGETHIIHSINLLIGVLTNQWHSLGLVRDRCVIRRWDVLRSFYYDKTLENLFTCFTKLCYSVIIHFSHSKTIVIGCNNRFLQMCMKKSPIFLSTGEVNAIDVIRFGHACRTLGKSFDQTQQNVLGILGSVISCRLRFHLLFKIQLHGNLPESS